MTKPDEPFCVSAIGSNGPLFVEADEPLLMFASITDAQRYMEVIDVINGVYGAAYGSRGKKHRIETDGAAVRVVRTSEQHDPDGLKAALLRYFAAVRTEVDASKSLEYLVSVALHGRGLGPRPQPPEAL